MLRLEVRHPMPLIIAGALANQLVPPLEKSLTEALLREYISLERRFVLRDWEPAALDGGQFCELLARILYHMDSGNLNLNKGFDECLNYLTNDQVSHAMLPRHNALHLEKVLRAAYKFRSQRGAIHISPNYQANHMDARFIV